MTFQEDKDIRKLCMSLETPEVAYRELFGITTTKPVNPTKRRITKTIPWGSYHIAHDAFRGHVSFPLQFSRRLDYRTASF